MYANSYTWKIYIFLASMQHPMPIIGGLLKIRAVFDLKIFNPKYIYVKLAIFVERTRSTLITAVSGETVAALILL
jgi:hypothetical protein